MKNLTLDALTARNLVEDAVKSCYGDNFQGWGVDIILVIKGGKANIYRSGQNSGNQFYVEEHRIARVSNWDNDSHNETEIDCEVSNAVDVVMQEIDESLVYIASEFDIQVELH